jgi:hypothetical protein
MFDKLDPVTDAGYKASFMPLHDCLSTPSSSSFTWQTIHLLFLYRGRSNECGLWMWILLIMTSCALFSFILSSIYFVT